MRTILIALTITMTTAMTTTIMTTVIMMMIDPSTKTNDPRTMTRVPKITIRVMDNLTAMSNRDLTIPIDSDFPEPIKLMNPSDPMTMKEMNLIVTTIMMMMMMTAGDSDGGEGMISTANDGNGNDDGDSGNKGGADGDSAGGSKGGEDSGNGGGKGSGNGGNPGGGGDNPGGSDDNPDGSGDNPDDDDEVNDGADGGDKPTDENAEKDDTVDIPRYRWEETYSPTWTNPPTTHVNQQERQAMRAALEIQRLLHGAAARARLLVRADEREPNLDWPPNTCTDEQLLVLEDAAIESIHTFASSPETINENELTTILDYIKRAEEIQEIDNINLSYIITENMSNFLYRWMIRYGDKYPRLQVQKGLRMLIMKVTEAETKAEQDRIVEARMAQHAEEEGEPEHSYYKLVATNVNGRLRLKDREHLLQQNDEALDDEAVLNDQTMQREPDCALATIVGWLQDPTANIAGVWAVETHLDDKAADEIIDYLSTYHPAIGALVSIKLKEDSSAGLVFLYRADVLEPLTPLQPPFAFFTADGHPYPRPDRLPKPRPENDRLVRHVWPGRLADVRLKWSRDSTEMITTGVYVPQVNREEDNILWFEMATQDWTSYNALRGAQGDFNATPRHTGRKLQTAQKKANQRLDQLLAVTKSEPIGDLTQWTHQQPIGTAGQAPDARGVTRTTIDLNVIGEALAPRLKACDVMPKTSGDKSFHRSVGYYYRVKGKDSTRAQVARPSIIDKIGKSKKEIESETPTGWQMWTDLIPSAVFNAARQLSGMAPREKIKPDLVATAFSTSNPVTAITVFKYHIMETALLLQQERARKDTTHTTKTEHLRKLEEKWLKMISTVNALPEDDKSFDKHAEVRPEYETSFKLREIPKAIIRLPESNLNNKARKVREMALVEKAYNAAVEKYSRRLNDATLDLLAEEMEELSTKTEARGGFQHEAWRLAKEHSIAARTKSFQPRNASGISTLQLDESAKKGESPTVSGDKFRVLLANRYAAKQAARPGHPGPWLHLADAVDLLPPQHADISTDSSAEDGLRYDHPSLKPVIEPGECPTRAEIQHATEIESIRIALDHMQSSLGADTRRTFEAFDSQINRVKMNMATGTDKFHVYFIRKGGTLGKKVYKYLLSRLYEAEMMDKAGLTWQIAMALKAKRNPHTVKGYRDIMVSSHDWKIITGCMGTQYQRCVERRRPSEQIAYESGTSSSCTRITLGHRARTTLAMHRRERRAEFMSDFSSFFPSIIHKVVFEAERRIGAQRSHTRMLWATHARVVASIRTASGMTPTRPINRGVGQGCKLGGPRSLIVTLPIIELQRRCIPAQKLIAPNGFGRNGCTSWMSDDQTSDPPPFDSLVQLAIDVFMHGAEPCAQLQVDHEAEAADKTSAKLSHYKNRGPICTDDETNYVHVIKQASRPVQRPLARCQEYKQIGTESTHGTDFSAIIKRTTDNIIALVTHVSKLGVTNAEHDIRMANSIIFGTLSFPSRGTPFPARDLERISIACRQVLVNHGHLNKSEPAAINFAPRSAGGREQVVPQAVADASLVTQTLLLLNNADGDRDKAAIESLFFVNACAFGWTSTNEEPNPIDFDVTEVQDLLLEALPWDAFQLALIRLELRIGKTTRDSQSACSLRAHVPADAILPEEKLVHWNEADNSNLRSPRTEPGGRPPLMPRWPRSRRLCFLGLHRFDQLLLGVRQPFKRPTKNEQSSRGEGFAHDGYKYLELEGRAHGWYPYYANDPTVSDRFLHDQDPLSAIDEATMRDYHVTVRFKPFTTLSAELRERHVHLDQEDRRNLSALCEIFKAAHRYEQGTNDLIDAIHAFAHKAAAAMLERDQEMLENIAEFAQQQAGQRLGDKFVFIGRKLRAQRPREDMLEQIRKSEEVTEHTDEHVYETQREYSEQHTYEYLSREAIIDTATKYENAWEHERKTSPRDLVKYLRTGSLHTAAECIAALQESDLRGTQARSFAEHLQQLDASGTRPDLTERHGALDDEATARAIIATTEELIGTWAPSQWHAGESPAETQLVQDRTRLQRTWRRPRRQTYVRGGIDDRGKHTLSLEPSKEDKTHARRFFQPLNPYSKADSCYKAVNTTGGILFKNSTSIYDCINPQVCCTPLLAIFTRVRSLEDGTGIKVVDWTGEEITVKILDKEKIKMNADKDRELLQRLAPMEDQRKYTAVWFGDGGRKGADGAPDRRVSWGAVVVWKSSGTLMRNYHLGALHPECDIQHGELMQIYKSTEFCIEQLRQGETVRMLCGSDSQTCADDIEAARSARNHRDLHDYDASIMIETIVHNIMTIEAKGGIWDLFRVPGHSYTPNVIADALATAAQTCQQFSQEVEMKTDRAFVVLCDRTEEQPFWLQYDKGAKMFRYLRLRGQLRRTERELREFHAKHAKNLVAQVKQDQTSDLAELIKIKLKSTFGVPLSKAMLERKVQAQVQEQLNRDRDETQKKLDMIIYPILNYDALPSLGVKTDAPRWTTAVEQFVAEPWLTRSATRFNVSFQFANTALRTDASVIPGITVCPLCKRDVSPTVWHLMTECTLKTCELNMPHLPPRIPLPMIAQDPMTTDDEATAPSAKVDRGSNAYLAQEILWTLREFRPAGEAWPTDLLEPSEKNTFLKEFNRACTTLELSCQSRQRDDDRGIPPVLDNDGEIAKFDTLRFLACHLPRDPLASVFKMPKDEEGKVNKNQAEEMHEKKKTFFEVWERLHQLIVEAITQAKTKYNRMSAASRAASREDDQAPQFRETNAYQINQTTPARAERAQAQRNHRDERNERRSVADLLELNKKY